MFKNLIISIFLTTSLMASYNVGDKLDFDSIKKLNLKSDKIYILDFFAAWCVSCKIELPMISKLNNTIDKSKYKIIGINVDENIEDGKLFVKELALNFDIVYDTNSELISKFDPIGIPALYYIENFRVKKVIFGAVHDIDKKILNNLKDMRN